MEKGTVKWFSTEKKFGFLAADDGGKDIFMNQTATFLSEKGQSMDPADLNEGDRVEYELALKNVDKPCAILVRVLSRKAIKDTLIKGHHVHLP